MLMHVDRACNKSTRSRKETRFMWSHDCCVFCKAHWAPTGRPDHLVSVRVLSLDFANLRILDRRQAIWPESTQVWRQVDLQPAVSPQGLYSEKMLCIVLWRFETFCDGSNFQCQVKFVFSQSDEQPIVVWTPLASAEENPMQWCTTWSTIYNAHKSNHNNRNKLQPRTILNPMIIFIPTIWGLGLGAETTEAHGLALHPCRGFGAAGWGPKREAASGVERGEGWGCWVMLSARRSEKILKKQIKKRQEKTKVNSKDANFRQKGDPRSHVRSWMAQNGPNTHLSQAVKMNEYEWIKID